MANVPEQKDIRAGAPRSLAEINSGEGVELERVTDLSGVELEAFMHEMVVVNVHKTKEKGSLDIINPMVNGLNQPVVRGVDTPIKRKYVEVMIYSHSVDYEQRINPQSPDQFKMVAKPTPSYPFQVVQDTRKGHAWKARLDQQLEQSVR